MTFLVKTRDELGHAYQKMSMEKLDACSGLFKVLKDLCAGCVNAVCIIQGIFGVGYPILPPYPSFYSFKFYFLGWIHLSIFGKQLLGSFIQKRGANMGQPLKYQKGFRI